MCGIAGFVDKKGNCSDGEKRKIGEGMLALIKHRGPDGSGLMLEPWGSMVHARLSIMDLSDAAAQPMWDSTGSLALSFNGEIYNHNNFKKELTPRYTFHTHSDTESLLYAYAAWGEQCLLRMKGMFAFSLYNQSEATLLLAIDRFGIKPLYYIDTEEYFAWSSEVKAFAALPHFTFQVNQERVSEFLMFRSLAGQDTLFKDIKKLLPGEKLKFDLNTFQYNLVEYWSLHEQNIHNTDGDPIELLLELLKKSTKEHLLSDVTLGTQLSGGVDSSLVTALVQEAENIQGLQTFSIGLSDSAWNEFPYSDSVASQLGTKHHKLLFTEEEFCRELPRATFYYDEPIHHSHSIPMMLLSRFAKKKVTVLLSGEGADEIFGGYDRYSNFIDRGNHREEDFLLSNALVGFETISRIIKTKKEPDFRERLNILNKSKHKSPLYRLGHYDLYSYLPSLLLRQDKMGMSVGLENRVPFLDHELVVAVMSLSDSQKIQEGRSKYLLKTITERYFTKDFVNRKKVGFGQPIAEWLRNRSGLGVYLSYLTSPLHEREFLDYCTINTLIEEHVSARADHSLILWNLLTLEVWMQIFIDQRPIEDIWEKAQR